MILNSVWQKAVSGVCAGPGSPPVAPQHSTSTEEDAPADATTPARPSKRGARSSVLYITQRFIIVGNNLKIIQTSSQVTIALKHKT